MLLQSAHFYSCQFASTLYAIKNQTLFIMPCDRGKGFVRGQKKCNLRWSKLNLCLFFLIYRQKQDEVMKLESQIRTKAEEQRKSGQELDSTCQICLKTKFADGIGHLCNYCNVRCCARCGGKVALRSSKVCYLQKKISGYVFLMSNNNPILTSARFMILF